MPDGTGATAERHQRLDTFETTMRQYSRVQNEDSL